MFTDFVIFVGIVFQHLILVIHSITNFRMFKICFFINLHSARDFIFN